jgi:hypothetical protein
MTVEVRGKMGLGAVLSHAGNALYVAEQRDIDVALRFTSPTYAPSWGADDWLDCYFVRLGSHPGGRPVCDSHDVPLERAPQVRELGPLVWTALRVRDEITSSAAAAADGVFAAVHFRGSDKWLEAPATTIDGILDVVENEMNRQGLGRLFVASDEPRFVEAAHARFGDCSFSLPTQAVASADGTPPHFTNAPGETKAREALMTMLILARAKLLVKTESLLSDWAMTLATDQRVVRVGPG